MADLRVANDFAGAVVMNEAVVWPMYSCVFLPGHAYVDTVATTEVPAGSVAGAK
jgi:hypothetical protein